MVRPVVLVLTIVTGFSGLAYEVAWQKYFAILLGAHSEATAAVLAIFLGGLALGYQLFGRLTATLIERSEASGTPPPLLLVYGGVEAGIGVYALLFPWIFSAARALSLALPGAGGAFSFAFDVALTALLIGPPAILMGATIPILTQALSRSVEDATRFHALIYAFNTVGAFAGALAAGFVLVPALGLAGVVRAMGVVNILVGGVIAWIGRRPQGVADLGSGDAPTRPVSPVYGGVALLMGLAMMAIQTVLIRVGGLALGSSEFTFSMVVAVFVLCIALGSLAVSALNRIAAWVLPATLWLLCVALVFLHARLPDSQHYAHVIRTLFRDMDAAFGPYHLFIVLALIATIGPVVVLSGSVLPLLFHAVRRELGDLGASAGRLYALNTLGSLLGALFGGYWLLFVVDLEQVHRMAIGAVVVSALVITARQYTRVGLFVGGALAASVAGALVQFAAWPEVPFGQGLFRERVPTAWTFKGPDARPKPAVSLFYDDGPTSSVTVDQYPNDAGISLIVNGKSDGHTVGDLNTMALAALVPALFSERAEESFVIGFGTGISAGELAALDEARRVTVAEISSAVVAAAPLFDDHNGGVSNHAKVEIVRRDAYRALLERDTRYDVILSEPSNPWVAGVEMLFSREFLEASRDRLRPGGVFAQWFHLYETDAESMGLVLRTYLEVFDEVAVWQTQPSDVILLGFMNEDRALDLDRLLRRARQPDFARRLRRLGIGGPAMLLVHEWLPLGVLKSADLEGPIHTLERPLLSHTAGRAFFRGGGARPPFTGYGEPARVGQQNSLLARYLARFERKLPPRLRERLANRACQTDLVLFSCWTLLADWSRAAPKAPALRKMIHAWPPAQRSGFEGRLRRLRWLLGDENVRIAEKVPPRMARSYSEAFDRDYNHALPFELAALATVWERCTGAEAFCEAGMKQVRELEAGRPGLEVPEEPKTAPVGRGVPSEDEAP